MSSNSLGDNFRITTFGESHGPAIGVVIDGVKGGIPVDIEAIQRQLERRRPGTSSVSSERQERDRLQVLAGLTADGRTSGAPIAFVIFNEDHRPEHYQAIRDVFRPGHADYTWWHKFGIRDWRGGGRASGRETAVRVAAGALARQLLASAGITVTGRVIQVGDVRAETYDPAAVERNAIRCGDDAAARRMVAVIDEARQAGDSVGGVVEVVATGVPAGLGDPLFQKLDAQIAAAMMSIGAVKGVEIGAGFALTRRRGSESNDPITPAGFASNNMGGILGGISNGAPVVARLAVKPTPSIRRSQPTVDVDNRPTTITVEGRHDPCICGRVVPVAEAMMALVLADAHLRQQAIREQPADEDQWLAERAYWDAELLRLLQRRVSLPPLSPEHREQLVGCREDLAGRLGLSEANARRLFAAVDEACSTLEPSNQPLIEPRSIDPRAKAKD